MSQTLSPLCCRPVACCGDTFILQQTGTSEGGCSKQGSVRPEGNVVADPGCLYRFDDGTEYEIWYKDTGTGLATGWVLWIKLA